MMSIITPEELDYYALVNEVVNETYDPGGWADTAAQLAEQMQFADTEMVCVTDAEGEFICLCSRKMAVLICDRLNRECTRCGHEHDGSVACDIAVVSRQEKGSGIIPGRMSKDMTLIKR